MSAGALGLAAGCASSAASRARILGANDAVRIGVVGLHGRGRDHLGGFRKLKGVRITALCDVDEAVLAAQLADSKKRGENAQGFADVRELLAAGVCDGISVATPNHTHALIGVWAAQHGVSAYIEKPLSHDVWQGRQVVAAAATYKTVIQTGSQCRSNVANQEAIAYVQSGALGRLRLARGLCYKPRKSIGKVAAPLQPPANVNYDLWLGPAAQQPVRRTQFHYDWHWQWAFGNGDLGNQGVHQMDLARWGLGQDQLPPQVLSVGGRLGYEDDGETPNSQVIWLGYEPAPLLFEVRGLPERSGSDKMDQFLGARIGVVFHCEHGCVVLTGYEDGHAQDLDGKVLRRFKGGGDHYGNFLAAMRAGDPGLLTADAQQGFLSAALCHLGNESQRAGRVLAAVPLAERLRAQPDVSEAFLRLQQHLGANGVPLDGKAGLALGAMLRPAADGRDQPRPQQREGFVVPELAG
jgi:predicted dehydrogenase